MTKQVYTYCTHRRLDNIVCESANFHLEGDAICLVNSEVDIDSRRNLTFLY